MQTKAIRIFTNSAGAVLLALSIAKLFALWGNFGLVQPRDPVLLISMRTIFWILAACELGVALACLFGRQAWLKLAVVFWLSSILVIYQVAFLSTPHHNFSFYLASLARAFDVTPDAAYLFLRIVFVSLWFGSAGLLIWLWCGSRGFLKCACENCGEHISFPLEGISRRITCPHCAAKTTLRAPPGTVAETTKHSPMSP
jgi:hypothetical protein